MESKAKSSFGDDPRSRDQGPSALRRLTSSPTGRLSLMRQRRSSMSTSRSSIDSTAPQSCVTRETARDECAMHRFFVWVAVKRNACERMTESEKLECPLLRCRKRFPNHELMLKHLYACDELPSGEYWCYDCGRSERFTDAKCKRCLGHPTKRRKILSMAKNFFSQLGPKHRRHDMADVDLDEEHLVPPPSYDSLDLEPQEAELFSTEIVEIDSTEISAPALRETVVAPQPIMYAPLDALRTGGRQAAELRTMPTLGDEFLNWDPSPSGHMEEVPVIDRSHNVSPERPSLQLDTAGLGQYRAKAARSKVLAPSSSVRSTTSTTSTTSTATTSTTASSRISPMSAWSGAWTMGSGIDTTLTSPTTDSPGGLTHSNSLRFSRKDGPEECKDDAGMDDFFRDVSFELPGDMPLPHPLVVTSHDALGLEQPQFSFDPSVGTELSIVSNMAFTDDSVNPLHVLQPPMEDPMAHCIEAIPFVGSAWDALQAHVANSLDRLRPFKNNPIANQLRSMSPKSVASTGLATLKGILGGHVPGSPIDALCFVHVAYSFSLVVHEEDTEARSQDFFVQAVSYASQFPPGIRSSYIDIATAIWQPEDFSPVKVQDLLFQQYIGPPPILAGAKGKEREVLPSLLPKPDALVSVAQYFLDELEFSILPSKTPQSTEVLTSELWMQHLQTTNAEVDAKSPFVLTVSFILKLLSAQYVDIHGFGSQLKDVQRRITSGDITTVRRAELELLQAGKSCMPTNVYFDDFVSFLRHQCNPLYEQPLPGASPRATWYGRGIDLVEAIIDGLTASPGQNSRQNQANDAEGLDDLFKELSDPFSDPSYAHLLRPESMTAPDLRFDLTTINPSTLEETRPGLTSHVPEKPPMYTFVGAAAAAAAVHLQASSARPGTSYTQAGSTPTARPTTPAFSGKVEANSCCEICGYRPKGDPQWFKGSMAKHKKLQHATSPPKIYKCPYPGCTSQYKNRPDNLRQHQIDKGHFVSENEPKRPYKRRKV